MHENSTTTQEGSPAVEQAEKQVLGERNYQKAEVVHRFADTHPWFYSLLLGGVMLISACTLIAIMRFLKRKQKM